MSDKCWIRMLNGAPVVVAHFPDRDHVTIKTPSGYLTLTREFWRTLPIAR
jgi:hypothetical protein